MGSWEKCSGEMVTLMCVLVMAVAEAQYVRIGLSNDEWGNNGNLRKNALFVPDSKHATASQQHHLKVRMLLE